MAPRDEVMEKRRGASRSGERGGLGLSGIPGLYSHPLPLQTPVLPPTITDQIRLWELERDRLRFTEGECLLVVDSRSLAGGRTIQS